MPPDERLKLLHINSAPKWNGEAAHSVELCAGLARRGHEVFWAGAEGSPALERARAAGIPTLGLRLQSSFGWTREIGDIRRLRRLIAEWSPDVVQCHRGKDHLAAVAALRWGGRRPLDVPLVRTRHVVMPVRQFWGNRYLWGRATYFLIAVSSATARSLGDLWPGGEEGVTEARRLFEQTLLARPGEAFDLDGRRAAIVLSAANLDTFRPERRDMAWRAETWGVSPETCVVGLVGRLQRIKGQKHLLDAAKLLAERLPDVHFVSVGHGSPARLEALAREGAAALGDRWHVTGAVEDIARAIASFDVGVVASFGSEGSSRVMYEYLASGLPAASTRVGGIPEMCEVYPGIDLELAEVGDAAALAEAIARQVAKVKAGRPQAYPPEVTARLGQERWLDNFEQLYAAIHRKWLRERSSGNAHRG